MDVQWTLLENFTLSFTFTNISAISRSATTFIQKFFYFLKITLRMNIKTKICKVRQKTKTNVKCFLGTKVFKFLGAAIHFSDFDLSDR